MNAPDAQAFLEKHAKEHGLLDVVVRGRRAPVADVGERLCHKYIWYLVFACRVPNCYLFGSMLLWQRLVWGCVEQNCMVEWLRW